MRYIGLDVHKDNITACVLSDAGKVVFEKDFKKTDGTCDCLAELFDHVGKSGFCVLMETGTYAYHRTGSSATGAVTWTASTHSA